MVSEFQYKGFQPDDPLMAEADCMLDRILDIAPLSASTFALLSYDGTDYTCSLDVFSRRGPLSVSSTRADVLEALQHAEKTMLEKLSKQKETRFFSRRPDKKENRPSTKGLSLRY